MNTINELQAAQQFDEYSERAHNGKRIQGMLFRNNGKSEHLTVNRDGLICR
jgi:hypothetical protein